MYYLLTYFLLVLSFLVLLLFIFLPESTLNIRYFKTVTQLLFVFKILKIFLKIIV